MMMRSYKKLLAELALINARLDKLENADLDERARLEIIDANIHFLNEQVNNSLLYSAKILSILEPRAQSLTVTIAPNSSTKGMILMPATIQVGGTGQAVAHEWTGPGGTGTELPLAGPISWTSDDPAVATVDPTSGVVMGVAAGTANIVGTDGTNGLSGSDLVTVPAQVAQSLTVVVTPN